MPWSTGCSSDFYIPLAAIRRRRRGYAVAIVKAGLELAGRPTGRVRPPLVDLSPADARELAALIARAEDDRRRPGTARPAEAGRAAE